MKFFIRNTNFSISISLTYLWLVGLWAPEGLEGNKKWLYHFYGCLTFLILLGPYLITQMADFFVIWGDLPLMTNSAFVLFTNIAQTVKIINLLAKRDMVKKIIADADQVLSKESSVEGKIIIKRCNRETSVQHITYFTLVMITVVGLVISPEKGMLALRASYPYDTAKSPAYELTRFHQTVAIITAALLNMSKDILVLVLIAQCRCRLQLLGMRLRTLCEGLQLSNKLIFTPRQEEIAMSRLRSCIQEHQAALEAAVQIESCFSLPTFVQFTVSRFIICVTAFQLVSQTGNLVRSLSMWVYLATIMYQVYIYCYQGHHLSEESSDVAGAAYECPWYAGSPKLRRVLLIVMTRTRREARIIAGGFTTLSLLSFMTIIKASYSLFTFLKQFHEEN